MKALRPLNAGLWGISVALSWMWGLGLFFSVQFTFQFGFYGLLAFAFTNALGLFLFGLVTGILGKRLQGTNSLEVFFTKIARPFRLVFYLYQLLALTLTIFAIVKYLFFALDLGKAYLVMPLVVLIVLATACLFGEEFNIRRIKFSHGIMFAILLVAVGIMIWVFRPFDIQLTAVAQGQLPINDGYFWGYFIPICVGFLIGPWLDLQQWQRAIQIQKEKTSVGFSYLIGATLFGLLLVFHGVLALWALSKGAHQFSYAGIDGVQYAHDLITKLLVTLPMPDTPWIPVAYYTFIGICILTTLDSGYLALRWFLKENLKEYNNAMLALIPNSLITSPIPSLIFGGVFSLIAVAAKLEMEYFMVFFATFFVGYGALVIIRCFSKDQTSRIPQIKMFSMGSLAVVIFAFGYFLKGPVLMIGASLLPLLYILWLLFGDKALTGIENVVLPENESVDTFGAPNTAPRVLHAPAATGTGLEMEPVVTLPLEPHQNGSEYFEGKWFVHAFKATYQDTNSTGNVYFGMYAMWVGKTRELFFHHAMPKFNVKDSPYLILTRSFEHKFIRETREFEKVAVKIRVSNFNRKFVTMEHQIFDSNNQMLGRGQQSLLFVSSKDYSLMDIPQEVLTGFTEHL